MVEVKTYCFGMAADELYAKIATGESDILMEIVKGRKEFVGVHPTKDGMRYLFLFLTPQSRDEAYIDAMGLFSTMEVIFEPAFVNAEHLKGGC